jgi:hypothetical protein
MDCILRKYLVNRLFSSVTKVVRANKGIGLGISIGVVENAAAAGQKFLWV